MCDNSAAAEAGSVSVEAASSCPNCAVDDTVEERDFNRVEVLEMRAYWSLPSRYTQLALKGSGAYSVVCRAYDRELGIRVAIKKLKRPFQTEAHAKFAFRETWILRHMDHPNIVRLVDAFTPQSSLDDFHEVYLVAPFMDKNLGTLLRCSGAQPEESACHLAYQLLCAVKYLHSVGIAHRDIKPENIGVTEDNALRLLDFGQARLVEEDPASHTGYVVTRWYRAPEVLLCRRHDLSVDLWSVGCVLAELIQGAPLFQGEREDFLFERMVAVLGAPDADFMQALPAFTAQHVERLCEQRPACGLSAALPRASPAALDLVASLLVMNPAHRVTALDALAHPYLQEYADPAEEPDAAPLARASVEREYGGTHAWKEALFAQLRSFRPSAATCAKLVEECGAEPFPA